MNNKSSTDYDSKIKNANKNTYLRPILRPISMLSCIEIIIKVIYELVQFFKT